LVDGVHVTRVYVWCVIYHGYQPEIRRCIFRSYNAGCSQKRDKIVPPSFKVLVKKKANHIVKQTFVSQTTVWFLHSVLNFRKK